MTHFLMIAESASRAQRVEFNEILYLKSADQHVYVVTKQKTFAVLIGFRQLEKKLPKQFKRIHPAYIVPLERIVRYDLESGYVLVNSDQSYGHGIRIPVGNEFRKNWYRRHLIPGWEISISCGLRSLLRDILFDDNNN